MSKENLSNDEGIEKLKTLIDDIDICMFSSFPKNSPYPHTIPMSRQEVDVEGNIWFIYSSESQFHKYIMENPKVTLSFSDVKNYKFLNVNGLVEIINDQNLVDKYWNKFIESWFNEGKEDPRIRIIKYIPKEAYYWDNGSNKLLTLLKITTQFISGNKLDPGNEGSIHL